ncbi:TetR/AcrR family transcriptional regulator [Demequina muriae]|uniref:TetR family transcriptional regulator n=1 Tax=Demequina muriae TaxID=3051664 RepID=A0ABT8GKC3_9MICO|nr:TetR family transcriptional regulator [Demequina sp. EGI L300058]MDN4481381.1 TetR family transcriptional regulator [Demequina sp. EGI L300058]
MDADRDGDGYQKGRDTRAQILDAAMRQFAVSGYRGSSLRDIAASAGLTHPGLLYHFPTKASLLSAVLEYRDRVDSQDRPVRGELGLDALRSMVASARHNETQRGIVELFAVLSAEATGTDHPAHEYFARRYATLLARVTSAYEVARDEGALRPGIDPSAAASQLVALMDGLQVQWLMGARPTPMGDLVKAHIDAQLTRPL